MTNVVDVIMYLTISIKQSDQLHSYSYLSGKLPAQVPRNLLGCSELKNFPLY